MAVVNYSRVIFTRLPTTAPRLFGAELPVKSNLMGKTDAFSYLLVGASCYTNQVLK